ncbi:hypothetical protein DFP72DRAFT_1063230 [Ephemerocybe angulata]|uniref:Tetraspanin n=1 Tax=Ephemerocybe angulata TaxID=980116 RepID=A0A8H6I754_9AGAR|nr:hypothetical protein DFP72DRAFT_1063230 [Tulosesus angulatus]
MAAKFLFCLPLRLGVILFTLFQFVICGGAAGLVWYAYALLHKNPADSDRDTWADLPKEIKIVWIVLGVVYSLASFVGLLGFLGAIFKKTGFVRTYLALLWCTFLLQLGSGIWSMVTFYRARGRSQDDCLKDSTDQNRLTYCAALEELKKIPQGYIIASSIVPIVIIAYALYVVHHYIKRLQKQQYEKEMAFKPKSGFTTVKGKEETYPLTQPTTTYPYSDSGNAFGHKKTGSTAYAPVAHNRV